MASRPKNLHKSVPPTNGFIFPTPVDDARDIFKVGARYQGRWFSSEVCIPQGALSWVDKELFRPFATKLAIAVSAAGFPATMEEFNGRYIINGKGLEAPPLRVNLPTCKNHSVGTFLQTLEKKMKRGTEADALHWVEFLQSHLPMEVKSALKKCPKLTQLVR